MSRGGSDKTDESLKRLWTKLMTFRSLLVSSLHATENGKTLTWRSATQTSTTPSSPTMASGESPYKRTTYRCSPSLLGKVHLLCFWYEHNLFVVISLLDLLVGLFIREILKLRKVSEKVCTVSVMVWLLNPFTFTIGTRGNCCAMILWIIISLMKGTTSHTYIKFAALLCPESSTIKAPNGAEHLPCGSNSYKNV
ncbi:hypothetical protein F2Q70_00041530 [Brassica cretica]|uniref:GPI mannosyltransferase I n=1 Tax=Brassica cretica TaxID=69181 RepID=A0A8S9K4P2_BRACR|nr:hypothetical protein F2Q70_00041530 [Brassica cretica]